MNIFSEYDINPHLDISLSRLERNRKNNTYFTLYGTYIVLYGVTYIQIGSDVVLQSYVRKDKLVYNIGQNINIILS